MIHFLIRERYGEQWTYKAWYLVLVIINSTDFCFVLFFSKKEHCERLKAFSCYTVQPEWVQYYGKKLKKFQMMHAAWWTMGATHLLYYLYWKNSTKRKYTNHAIRVKKVFIFFFARFLSCRTFLSFLLWYHMINIFLRVFVSFKLFP